MSVPFFGVNEHSCRTSEMDTKPRMILLFPHLSPSRKLLLPSLEGAGPQTNGDLQLLIEEDLFIVGNLMKYGHSFVLNTLHLR